MALTSKQRAALRGAANTMDPVYQIGKGEIDETLKQGIADCIAAAILAQTCWGIEDPEILSAIRCHTTGKPDMSLQDKILYLADMTSAERDWPGVEALRALEMEDLDRALCEALKQSIDFVEERGGALDPESVAAYEYAKAHLK